MSIFENEPVRPKKPHEIGQDLSDLSVDELKERIGLLREEIARLEAEQQTKGATLNAAEAMFRPG
ncbi:MAG: DUF1192 domain-containing protein [Devosia indica]